mmetsp:Transcript_111078/g.299520  ORF Transcript_111078/g.299520 Transcript_111078/m.299520 type:complete len:219 (+) Transcript_111078:1736-2392(+)
MLLHRRGPLIAAASQILEQRVDELRVREPLNRNDAIDVVACNLHRDGIVSVEVDAGSGANFHLAEDFELSLLLVGLATAILAPSPIASALCALLLGNIRGCRFLDGTASARLVATASARLVGLVVTASARPTLVVVVVVVAPTAALAAALGSILLERIESAATASAGLLLARRAAVTVIIACRRCGLAAGALLRGHVGGHLIGERRLSKIANTKKSKP